MGLIIKLFVQGALQGNKQWGNPTKAESAYLDQNYSSPLNLPEYMKVECRNIDGDKAVFYTFHFQKNVNGVGGRPDSYLSLTLKLNAYYVDIQNIYAILKVTCHKYCIGELLEERQNYVQYIIEDFQSKDQRLKELEKSVKDYINMFSHQVDLMRLDDIPLSKTGLRSLALSDSDKATTLQQIKQNGGIIVSEFYPSFKEQTIEKNFQKKLEEIKEDHEATIERLNQTSLQQQENLKRLLEEAQNNSKKRQNETANEYKAEIERLNQQITDLEKQLEKAQNNSKKWQNEANTSDTTWERNLPVIITQSEKDEHQNNEYSKSRRNTFRKKVIEKPFKVISILFMGISFLLLLRVFVCLSTTNVRLSKINSILTDVKQALPHNSNSKKHSSSKQSSKTEKKKKNSQGSHPKQEKTKNKKHL